MRATRPARRTRRRPGVVRVAVAAQHVVPYDVAGAWAIAMRAADLLRRHFPAFYAAHVAPARATLDAGLGACCAFWLLIERTHGLELRWPSSDSYGNSLWGSTVRDGLSSEDAPEDMLATFVDVGAEWMSGIGSWIEGPQPVYAGANVQSMITGDAGLQPGLLTGLLWLLLSQTSASVGGADMVAGALWHAYQDDVFAGIRPLRADVPTDRLFALVAAQIPEAQELPDPAQILRYPLGSTGNPLADTGEDDLALVYDGDMPDAWNGWGEAARLGELQCAARKIERAYIAWRDRVEAGGTPALRQVAACFHRAARRCPRAAPRTLVEILTEQEAVQP
jgi:hypothetical protein